MTKLLCTLLSLWCPPPEACVVTILHSGPHNGDVLFAQTGRPGQVMATDQSCSSGMRWRNVDVTKK